MGLDSVNALGYASCIDYIQPHGILNNTPWQTVVNSLNIPVLIKSMYYCNETHNIPVLIKSMYYCNETHNIPVLSKSMYYCYETHNIPVLIK